MRLLLVIFLASLNCFGAVYTAASVERDDVKAAIDLASTGDMVIIPVGAATWTNSLKVTNKAITLVGAGYHTIITRATTANEPLIQFSGTPTNLVRLSNFRVIDGGTTGGTSSIIQIGNFGLSHYLFTNIARVDHIIITNLLLRDGITFNGWSMSLADNCRIDSTVNGQMFQINGLGNANTTSTNAANATNMFPSWDTIPLSPGTTNMVVMEDIYATYPNTGSGNGTVDSYAGARWAARFFTGTNLSFGAHGTDSSGANRGTVWYELYGNNWTNNNNVFPFSFRGGSGLFASNTVVHVADTPQNFIRIDNYRNSGTNIYYTTTNSSGFLIPCCNPFGPAAPGEYYVGGEDATGYPAMDQMGMGPPTIFGTTNVTQTHNPLYAWENYMDGVLGLPFLNATPYVNTGDYAYIPNSTNYIVSGRDYFDNTPRPGWTPLSYPHPLRVGADHNVTITSLPMGATITTTADLNSVLSVTTPGVNLYIDQMPITLTAPATYSGLPFEQWKLNGETYSTDLAITPTVESGQTFQAVYVSTVQASGGIIFSGGIGIQ